MSDLTSRIQAARAAVSKKEALRDACAEEIRHGEDALDAVRLRRSQLAQAREILAAITRAKREETTRKLEEIVTAGLRGVLSDTTVHLRVMEHSTKRHVHYRFALAGRGYVSEDIREEKGGGVLNLVSFLLTVVLAVMLDPGTTRFFIFDEKFAHLSRNLMDGAGTLMGEMCRRLGAQVLMVSHQSELEEHADTAYDLAQGSDGVTSAVRSR